MPMWQYSYGYGMGGFLWMMLGLLLILGLIGLLIWGIFRLVEGRPHQHALVAEPRSALEILQQRFARGEIDEQTFLRMREQLAPRGAIPTDPTR